MLGLLQMELDTGPGTRKSSTLCSLLLLVIATFLVLEVPGQSNNDGSVGVANHKLIGKNVTLVDFTIKANETNFNSDEYRKRFPNACDVKIDSKTIELQYNNITGCTVDLLVKNEEYNNKINMPFVYSKNNKVVERLRHGPINSYERECSRATCGMCMPWTTLEISWSRVVNVYAYTHLVGDLGPGKDQAKKPVGEEMTLDMEIEDGGKFSMNFDGEKEPFDSSMDKILCVPKNNPFVAPETWTITNGDLKGKRLLVFSLLPVSASVVFDGKKLVDRQPGRVDRNYYELLYVSPPPPPTTTTTPTPKICSTEPAKTCAPCPVGPTEPACATCPACPSEPVIKCTVCPLCPVPTITSTTTTKTITPPAPSAETSSSSSFIWIFLFFSSTDWLYRHKCRVALLQYE
uniref:Uncharacterized protein n=1 Tax=Meloidogyne enterolobii TaxID=390850 RepID=A0A6V7YCB0_MELEN|nr:unnamed protein product [Meloidogyne enterolobii]